MTFMVRYPEIGEVLFYSSVNMLILGSCRYETCKSTIFELPLYLTAFWSTWYKVFIKMPWSMLAHMGISFMICTCKSNYLPSGWVRNGRTNSLSLGRKSF